VVTLLQQLITLARQAPRLTNAQLTIRLAGLAKLVR
jgi:hypothetical protein